MRAYNLVHNVGQCLPVLLYVPDDGGCDEVTVTLQGVEGGLDRAVDRLLYLLTHLLYLVHTPRLLKHTLYCNTKGR